MGTPALGQRFSPAPMPARAFRAQVVAGARALAAAGNIACCEHQCTYAPPSACASSKSEHGVLPRIQITSFAVFSKFLSLRHREHARAEREASFPDSRKSALGISHDD